MDAVREQLVPFITTYGIRVIGAIIILILGRVAAGMARSVVRKLLARANVDPSVTTFAASVVFALFLTFAVVASLSKFGIETTSFVAILASAGFAIGFALQGSLSNFASGVLILVLRPYRVGDVIDAAGVVGKVQSIQLFTTVLVTGDNIRILVPNGKIYGDVIKNMSANATRRVDLVVSISYDSSIKKAKELLAGLLEKDERILADPAPQIAVSELADSSVNFVVRPWVKKEDYWSVKCDLTEQIKETFDANGIDIPFPQRTVHMVSGSG